MKTGLVADTEYEPADDWTDVDDLDGININHGQGCPHCGAHPRHLEQSPAGYYHCGRCLVRWAGDRESASLEAVPVYGPVGSKTMNEPEK